MLSGARSTKGDGLRALPIIITLALLLSPLVTAQCELNDDCQVIREGGDPVTCTGSTCRTCILDVNQQNPTWTEFTCTVTPAAGDTACTCECDPVLGTAQPCFLGFAGTCLIDPGTGSAYCEEACLNTGQVQKRRCLADAQSPAAACIEHQNDGFYNGPPALALTACEDGKDSLRDCEYCDATGRLMYDNCKLSPTSGRATTKENQIRKDCNPDNLPCVVDAAANMVYCDQCNQEGVAERRRCDGNAGDCVKSSEGCIGGSSPGTSCDTSDDTNIHCTYCDSGTIATSSCTTYFGRALCVQGLARDFRDNDGDGLIDEDPLNDVDDDGDCLALPTAADRDSNGDGVECGAGDNNVDEDGWNGDGINNDGDYYGDEAACGTAGEFDPGCDEVFATDDGGNDVYDGTEVNLHPGFTAGIQTAPGGPILSLVDEDVMNGRDDDGDGRIDEEGWGADGVDNDGDGWIDEDPPDNVDNDGDGLIDEDGWGADGVNNDGDFYADEAGCGTAGVFDPWCDEIFASDVGGNGLYDGTENALSQGATAGIQTVVGVPILPLVDEDPRNNNDDDLDGFIDEDGWGPDGRNNDGDYFADEALCGELEVFDPGCDEIFATDDDDNGQYDGTETVLFEGATTGVQTAPGAPILPLVDEDPRNNADDDGDGRFDEDGAGGPDGWMAKCIPDTVMDLSCAFNDNTGLMSCSRCVNNPMQGIYVRGETYVCRQPMAFGPPPVCGEVPGSGPKVKQCYLQETTEPHPGFPPPGGPPIDDACTEDTNVNGLFRCRYCTLQGFAWEEECVVMANGEVDCPLGDNHPPDTTNIPTLFLPVVEPLIQCNNLNIPPNTCTRIPGPYEFNWDDVVNNGNNVDILDYLVTDLNMPWAANVQLFPPNRIDVTGVAGELARFILDGNTVYLESSGRTALTLIVDVTTTDIFQDTYQMNCDTCFVDPQLGSMWDIQRCIPVPADQDVKCETFDIDCSEFDRCNTVNFQSLGRFACTVPGPRCVVDDLGVDSLATCTPVGGTWNTIANECVLDAIADKAACEAAGIGAGVDVEWEWYRPPMCRADVVETIQEVFGANDGDYYADDPGGAPGFDPLVDDIFATDDGGNGLYDGTETVLSEGATAGVVAQGDPIFPLFDEDPPDNVDNDGDCLGLPAAQQDSNNDGTLCGQGDNGVDEDPDLDDDGDCLGLPAAQQDSNNDGTLCGQDDNGVDEDPFGDPDGDGQDNDDGDYFADDPGGTPGVFDPMVDDIFATDDGGNGLYDGTETVLSEGATAGVVAQGNPILPLVDEDPPRFGWDDPRDYRFHYCIGGRWFTGIYPQEYEDRVDLAFAAIADPTDPNDPDYPAYFARKLEYVQLDPQLIDVQIAAGTLTGENGQCCAADIIMTLDVSTRTIRSTTPRLDPAIYIPQVEEEFVILGNYCAEMNGDDPDNPPMNFPVPDNRLCPGIVDNEDYRDQLAERWGPPPLGENLDGCNDLCLDLDLGMCCPADETDHCRYCDEISINDDFGDPMANCYDRHCDDDCVTVVFVPDPACLETDICNNHPIQPAPLPCCPNNDPGGALDCCLWLANQYELVLNGQSTFPTPYTCLDPPNPNPLPDVDDDGDCWSLPTFADRDFNGDGIECSVGDNNVDEDPAAGINDDGDYYADDPGGTPGVFDPLVDDIFATDDGANGLYDGTETVRSQGSTAGVVAPGDPIFPLIDEDPVDGVDNDGDCWSLPTFADRDFNGDGFECRADDNNVDEDPYSGVDDDGDCWSLPPANQDSNDDGILCGLGDNNVDEDPPGIHHNWCTLAGGAGTVCDSEKDCATFGTPPGHGDCVQGVCTGRDLDVFYSDLVPVDFPDPDELGQCELSEIMGTGQCGFPDDNYLLRALHPPMSQADLECSYPASGDPPPPPGDPLQSFPPLVDLGKAIGTGLTVYCTVSEPTSTALCNHLFNSIGFSSCIQVPTTNWPPVPLPPDLEDLLDPVYDDALVVLLDEDIPGGV